MVTKILTSTPKIVDLFKQLQYFSRNSKGDFVYVNLKHAFNVRTLVYGEYTHLDEVRYLHHRKGLNGSVSRSHNRADAAYTLIYSTHITHIRTVHPLPWGE